MQPKPHGKALLVGIDHYSHFPEHSLGGAQRDARRLKKYLVSKRGFREGSVEMLCNAAASRQGIRQGLERLLERSRENDCVVFFFAGHGTRRWQPNRRRADDYLSCIVPADSAHNGTAPNLDISGEELSAWLRQLKKATSNILLIFDSCHSGALVRKAGSTARWLDPDLREGPRYPEDWPWPIERLDGAQRGTGSWLPRSRSHTVLAACRISEMARELRDATGVCGAFTHHLLEQLSKNEEKTTYRDLIEVVRLSFRGREMRQSPQVEGAADRLLFGLEELTPMWFFSVLGRDGQHLQLDGGAVHRLTLDSSWKVFPPTTKSPTSSSCLGTVRLKTLAATRSGAEVVDELYLNAIGPGCRAVLSEPGDDWLPMKVHLESSKLGPDLDVELEAAISSSPWLCLASLPEEHEARVSTMTPNDEECPRLVILNSEDQLCAPHQALKSTEAIRTTVSNLEKRARYRRTLDLKNPDQNLLDGKIRMVVHRHESGYGPIPAEPRGPFGMLDFYDGEDFVVELTNLHDEPVFLYLLDFGVGGAIDLLYPEVEDLWRPIMPGHSVTVGDQMNEEMAFYVPDTYPYENPGISASGIETLKLFATLEATDFRSVFQESLRSGWSVQEMLQTGEFGELLSRLFLGAENREVRRHRACRNLAWTTLEIPLLLIRQENPE